MLVTIDKNEINAARYACALCDFKVDFYTVESTVNDNSDIVQAEILDEFGEEPPLSLVFHLGRQIEIKLACEAFANKK